MFIRPPCNVFESFSRNENIAAANTNCTRNVADVGTGIDGLIIGKMVSRSLAEGVITSPARYGFLTGLGQIIKIIGPGNDIGLGGSYRIGSCQGYCRK